MAPVCDAFSPDILCPGKLCHSTSVLVTRCLWPCNLAIYVSRFCLNIVNTLICFCKFTLEILSYEILFVVVCCYTYIFSVLSPVGAWDLTDKYAELALEIQKSQQEKILNKWPLFSLFLFLIAGAYLGTTTCSIELCSRWKFQRRI